jgi:hypothetical protein
MPKPLKTLRAVHCTTLITKYNTNHKKPSSKNRQQPNPLDSEYRNIDTLINPSCYLEIAMSCPLNLMDTTPQVKGDNSWTTKS